MECDASLVEINPLIVTESGNLLPLDGKVNMDDNALFRQKAIAELRDPSQEDEKERAAAAHGVPGQRRAAAALASWAEMSRGPPGRRFARARASCSATNCLFLQGA